MLQYWAARAQHCQESHAVARAHADFDFELRKAQKAVVREAREVEVANEVWAECGAYHNGMQMRHLLLVPLQISWGGPPLRQDEFPDM